MHRDQHWDAEPDEDTDWDHRRPPEPSGGYGPSMGHVTGGGHGPSGVHAPSGGHAHSHSHDTAIPVSRRTTRIVGYILIPCAVITAIAMIFLWPGKPEQSTKHQATTMQRAYGEILKIDHQPCPADLPTYGEPLPCGQALVHVTDGPGKDQDMIMNLPQGPGAPRVSVGDQVVLGVSPDPTAGGAPDRYEIIDEQRGKPMWLMLGLCAAVIVAFGRWRGLTALVGLVVSFAALLFFIIPAILGGEPPLLVAIVGSSAIMFAVLYLTHGVNVHTSVAILGTLAALVLTGLLGAGFIASTALTGFGSEETFYLSILNGTVDMRGLLLAGIIIGALGVLDDVTVTQATTVAEMAQGARSRLELFRSATRIGRAHVASAVNTIILAYAGASLPLLLLVAAGGQDVSDLLTSQFLAQEIVRSAVGTIGLVAAVPITTGLAALVADVRHAPGPRPRMSGIPAQDGPPGRHQRPPASPLHS